MSDAVKELFGYIMGAILSVTGLTADDFLITQTEVNYICKPQTGVSTSLMGYFAVAGMAVSLVYFLLEINQKYALEGRDLNFKSIGVPFFKLFVSYALLTHINAIVQELVNVGNAFINWAGNYNIDVKEISSTLDLGKLSFFKAIVILIPLICMMLVTIVCSLVWKYKAIAFKLELLFRVGLTPIATADIYSGQNSQAIRWCKALLGTMLYGASMMLIIKIGGAVALSSLTKSQAALNSWSSTVGIWPLLKDVAAMLVYPIAELGAISVVRQAIKEALA